MKEFSFKGKNVLITGASGGLGSTLVKHLAEMGSHLVISSRSYDMLNNLISTLTEETQIIPIPADLSLPGKAEKLAEKAVSALGHIDVLFNNAGIGYFALMEEATDENIRYLFELNTFAPLNLISALLPQMKSRGEGRIINIVSCAGRVPVPSVGIYGGSKTALAVMTNTMRLELEPEGIDIINIYPGTVDTSFEENALREKKRPGLRPRDHFGVSTSIISKNILTVATGPSGEVWLNRGSKMLATASLDWPKLADRRLAPLRDKVLGHSSQIKPVEQRRWRLLQLESSLAYPLDSGVSFREDAFKEKESSKVMPNEIWEAIRPHLPDIQSIDFTGGGEPLLQPRLADWIMAAKSAGCETGFQSDGIYLTEQISQQMIDAGVDWIAVPMYDAPADTEEAAKENKRFEAVCTNLQRIASLRKDSVPKIIINFVVTPMNVHQAEDMVILAARLGADQVNFKQYNIIRDDSVRQSGIFASKETKEVRRVKKLISGALRLGRKVKVETTSFSFAPDEQPVCNQEPENSLFIRYDGAVAPCSNLAIGGTAFFLGGQVSMPMVHYGHIPTQSLKDLWETETCKFFRNRFQNRGRVYDTTLAQSASEFTWPQLQKMIQTAIEAMPKAPEGCNVCRFLYDI